MTKEEAIQILSTRDAHGVLCGYTSGVTEALDMAIEALSAEAIEVVRCKNCKYGDKDYPKDIFPDATDETYSCDHSTYSHDKDFYCKYGERRKP